MAAFATAEDLGLRMKRNFTGEEQTWVTALLEDASDYLRSLTVWELYPRRQATFRAWPGGRGNILLPQHPVVSVDAVTSVPGAAVEWTFRDDSVYVRDREEKKVTFTFGYTTPPPELRRWACVLVSQAILPIELELGISIGGLSSVQLDDFRVAFANGGEQTGMQLSERNELRIRRDFGPPMIRSVETG